MLLALSAVKAGVVSANHGLVTTHRCHWQQPGHSGTARRGDQGLPAGSDRPHGSGTDRRGDQGLPTGSHCPQALPTVLAAPFCRGCIMCTPYVLPLHYLVSIQLNILITVYEVKPHNRIYVMMLETFLQGLIRDLVAGSYCLIAFIL